MNTRQYIFLGMLSVLLYLSYIIIEYEYKKFTLSIYVEEQKEIISEIKESLSDANKTIDYISSKAYKQKVLKSEQQLKMRGEEVILFTQEDTYNMFKSTHPKTSSGEINSPISKENTITNSMTNTQKWIYFTLKKDTR